MSIQGTLGSLTLPPLQRDVFDLDLVQDFEVGGKIGNFNALVEIFNADFDFGEVVEDIEFCEVEGGVSVNLGRVAKLHEIEPSTTTFTTGGGTILATHVLKMSADVLDLEDIKKKLR